MGLLPLIPFELNKGTISFSKDCSTSCKAFGSAATLGKVESCLATWREGIHDWMVLLVLAGTRTAEIQGISAAGATSDSRRLTALADAELLLQGPSSLRRNPLPPLSGGVSPALISYVASRLIGVSPAVIAAGLFEQPLFPHFLLEPVSLGPSACLTTGKAMSCERVRRLWDRGFQMGLKLRKPLLLAECVPGGTTTAQAVLTGLGLSVSDLISGSARNPPTLLKKMVVERGLRASGLHVNPPPQRLLAAVGDPFQPVAAGLLLGAREAGQQVLLGGGSQMLAVLALALSSLQPSLRAEFVEGVAIATTAWLVEETTSLFKDASGSALLQLIDRVGKHFDVDLFGLSTGLHFHGSSQDVLRDYECGYIKEGVGAGALALMAQIDGVSCKDLVVACEEAVDELQRVAN